MRLCAQHAAKLRAALGQAPSEGTEPEPDTFCTICLMAETNPEGAERALAEEAFACRRIALTEVSPVSWRPEALSVGHGASLIGRNIVDAAAGDLCRGSCGWCEALKIRIQSRTGAPFPT